MTARAGTFDEAAAGYARTMAPSLRPIAAEVVHRAALQPREAVLDVGSGTGNAAALARGEGRRVIGIDAAPAMLAIARAEVARVHFEEMDFAALRFADAAFDVVTSVHALLFADDQRAALAEWRRVTRPGGRLSLSVPGPTSVTPTAIYADVYERHGIDTSGRYPTPDSLANLVRAAGWAEVETADDPATAIVLAGEGAFREWRGIGSRGAATAHYTEEQHRSLTDAMLAVTPRDEEGSFRIPFGAIYLTARRPSES